MTEIKPLAYGYMRVPCDVEDQATRELELKLKDYTEQQGFCFASIFYEFRPALWRGGAHVQRSFGGADSHYVIVPSPSHVSPIRFAAMHARQT